MNDLFNALGGKPVQSPMMQMLNNFNQFRAGFTGDAKAEVEKLIRSGKVSQQQLNSVQAMANQLRGMIK